MRKIRNRGISFILLFCMVIGLMVIMPENVSANIHSQYVKDISIVKSGNKVTVTYMAEKVPNGANCYIGYEDWTGGLKEVQRIGKPGKHTITWTINSSVFRIYTSFSARGYNEKSIVKTYHEVKTGVTTYKVTQKDVDKARIQACSETVIISLASIGLGFWKMSLGVATALGGMGYGIISVYSYTPSVGDVIKTTTVYKLYEYERLRRDIGER